MRSVANGHAGGPGARRPPFGLTTRSLTAIAVCGIGAAIAVMLAVSVAGPSQAVVRKPSSLPGPPWYLNLHLPTGTVTVALWGAAVAGGVGVAAGLAAVARGARPSPRWLVAAALLVTAAFTVLPPAGSTDVLDYAAYGETVAIGHDPYLMTPYRLRLTGNPVGWAAPGMWLHRHSAYGPLATAEQFAAAELGGPSALRIAFWLKVWNSLFFIAVVIGLDRVLRRDARRRARAHLWWSLNPLLLWDLVASGHIDTIAAAIGVGGLLLVTAPRAGSLPSAARALAAGALVGAAADLKITFALFGLGVAWAVRRSVRALAAAAAGALAVLIPSYLWFGLPAVTVLLYRDASATSDNFYRMFARAMDMRGMPYVTVIALGVMAAVAVLLLRTLPPGPPSRPALRPALALSLAWLLAWPYQRPWYDAMAVCLLALYPATRLDVLVLARMTAVTASIMPGLPRMPGLPGLPVGWIGQVGYLERLLVIPLIRLGVLAVIVLMAVKGTLAIRGGPAREAGLPRVAVNGRSSAGGRPLPMAHARADGLPAPGNDGADRPGRRPPGPG